MSPKISSFRSHQLIFPLQCSQFSPKFPLAAFYDSLEELTISPSPRADLTLKEKKILFNISVVYQPQKSFISCALLPS